MMVGTPTSTPRRTRVVRSAAKSKTRVMLSRACSVVRDCNGQQLAYVYFKDVFEVPTVQSRPIPGAK
jgi:hypothetical protein